MTPLVAATPRNCFPISRAEVTLKSLKDRIHRHTEQEVRLGRLCQVWQQCWSAQHDQLRQQVERLEAHLAAWMPKPIPAPMLSVVNPTYEGE